MTTGLVDRPSWVRAEDGTRDLLQHEWLVTNGRGGYASGTVGSVMTRKYHGYLVAALPTPLGRMVMLQDLRATLRFPDGREASLAGSERADGSVNLPSEQLMRDFRLELGLPVWEYELDGIRLCKRIVMPHGQNSVYVTWERTDSLSSMCTLLLRPYFHVRKYEAAVTTPRATYQITVDGARLELVPGDGVPPVRLHALAKDARFDRDETHDGEVAYRAERDRGYEWVGDDWSPGRFTLALDPGTTVSVVASTESWAVADAENAEEALGAERTRREQLLSLAGSAASDTPGALLTLAADQFIITPTGRVADAARAASVGDEVRSVIAGYHWFTDWGRDTMISLEGLTLCTGRHREAGCILRTFAHYVRDGLLPNMFPDGASEGLYHTADATLWFFHAIHRHVQSTHDRTTLLGILPVLRDIIERHVAGTRFGIHVDPTDGLLVQGAEGYQLTWMDAKVDGWVVTPRRGKAVEINALWYNALKLLEGYLREEGFTSEAERLFELASHAHESFNRRFWNEAEGCLFDVVDDEKGGDDPAVRPNQIFAMSLDHPVLDESRWPAVLDAVGTRLLTPYGLRSLAPGHKDYKSRYFGDLRTRDGAYHQGTVWGWLIGPYVDAYLRVHPEDLAGARACLTSLIAHLGDFGVGSIAEVFDAEPPYTPRGCIAQAWSVAETLRAWRRTAMP